MNNLHNGTIVVTGGAGLIGSATVWGINNQNLDNIWLVDLLESNSLKERNLENLNYERNLDAVLFRQLISENNSELKNVKTIIHLVCMLEHDGDR